MGYTHKEFWEDMWDLSDKIHLSGMKVNTVAPGFEYTKIGYKVLPAVKDMLVQDFPALPKSSIMQEVIMSLGNDVYHKLESQILEALKSKGFDFKNRTDMERFAQSRCTIFSFAGSNKKELHVDGHYLCEWDETLTFSGIGTELKVTLGK